MELRVSTPVFQVRYLPLIKVTSALKMVSAKYRWIWRMVESRKPRCPYRRFHRPAEVAHRTEVLRCFWTSPREPVWTFRYFNIFGSLPIRSSALLLWLEFVHNNHLSWHLLEQQLFHADATECFSKKAKIGEARGRKVRVRAERRNVFRHVEQ